MLNFNHLKEMVGISSLELLEIRDHQTHLQSQAHDFQTQLESWLAQYEVQCTKKALEIMLPEYYATVISGNYGYEFYILQYRQAMHWRLCGLRQSKSLLLMNHIRKLLIVYAETANSHNLAKGLCHVMDMSQSIVATVYQISEEVDRMRHHVKSELSRIERSFGLIAMKPPEALIRPYLDHQEWKFLAFNAALGEDVHANQLELSHTKCRLAQWLNNEGSALMQKESYTPFHQAHKRVHDLGRLAIQYADLKQPEKILDLLMQMEAASQVLSDTLLNLIEDEFIRLATCDALTGMPNKRSFDLEFSKNIAFAERHNYWVGLVLIDVDFFKTVNDNYGHLIGDQVLREMAQIIKASARTEETTYRWGGEEFAVVTLDKQAGGAEVLAQRIRKAVEQHCFCKELEQPLKLTVSCGSICFKPPSTQPSHELFARVDKQLYLAKSAGRNRVEHVIL